MVISTFVSPIHGPFSRERQRPQRRGDFVHRQFGFLEVRPDSASAGDPEGSPFFTHIRDDVLQILGHDVAVVPQVRQRAIRRGPRDPLADLEGRYPEVENTTARAASTISAGCMTMRALVDTMPITQ